MNQDDASTGCNRVLSPIAFLLAIVASGCSDRIQSDDDALATTVADVVAETQPVAPRIHEPFQIEITGSAHRWHVKYPDASGQLAVEGESRPVRDIHVPLKTRVVLVLKSADYVYTLALPKYELKEIAVPGFEFQMEFRTENAGKFELVGDQLCGRPYPELRGCLIAESQEDFETWLKQPPPTK
jgi:heme/copper-type cytochrome/quinol oxidase subunit 2